MERDLLLKIQKLLDRGTQLSEDEVRSLMILLRKRLELEPDRSRVQFQLSTYSVIGLLTRKLLSQLPGCRFSLVSMTH